jgi:hypothetical protein
MRVQEHRLGRRASGSWLCGHVGVLLLAAGCGHTDATTTDDWQSALGALAAENQSLYSFRFTGPPPDGAFFQALSLGDGFSGAACAPDTNAASESYWELTIDLGGTVAGSYRITGDDIVGMSGQAANVTLLHRQNGEYTADYPAVAGTVTLPAAASLDGSVAGQELALTIDAQFPSHAVQRTLCRGGEQILPDGSAASIATSCDCKDAAGVTTTCTPSDGKNNCCIDTQSATVRFTKQLAAAECQSLCRVVVGLPDYCAEVQP